MMNENKVASESRRDFVKKAAYVAPAILTFPVMPAFAREGSRRPQNGLLPIESGPPHQPRRPDPIRRP
jgi:hypothetical protein